MTDSLPALIAALLLCACSVEQAPLVATDVAVSNPGPGMQMSAGYFSLANHTKDTITIDRVSSPDFESVKMHESILENGISRMVPLTDFAIPPGGSVQFKPGGKHLMLMGPSGGDEAVTLEFYAGDALLLTVNAARTD